MPALKDAETKIESLREKIRHHEYLYYVLDQPEISDLPARRRQATGRIREGPPLLADAVTRQHL
jgi:hypothetical protein